MSARRRRNKPPRAGLRPVQTRSILRYTPSASGHLSESAQVVLTKQLLPDSEARCATLFEKLRLDWRLTHSGAPNSPLVLRILLHEQEASNDAPESRRSPSLYTARSSTCFLRPSDSLTTPPARSASRVMTAFSSPSAASLTRRPPPRICAAPLRSRRRGRRARRRSALLSPRRILRRARRRSGGFRRARLPRRFCARWRRRLPPRPLHAGGRSPRWRGFFSPR